MLDTRRVRGGRTLTDHVVIVGGGTAGWLTAAILAADYRAADPDGLRVTLVESATVPTLGVGEGTWPSLRDTLRRIGIPESLFVARCSASFKQGSRFDGWRTGAPDDHYYHPFDPLPSEDEVGALALWRAAPPGTPFAFAVSAQAAICARGLAPKQAQTPDYAAVANYAYHLDAAAFADLLAEHCTQVLGVWHVTGDVAQAERAEDGRIARVHLANGQAVPGDLFVDCTGARALLIGQAMGAETTSLSDVLFNDRALALRVPNAAPDAPIETQTNAAAEEAGWVWDIALRDRRGIGYVHSSRHQDEDAARDTLTAYLRAACPHTQMTGADARLIEFRSAYRPTPWVRNCVGVGMAQGFVEPLEASAIVMAELSAAMISDTLPSRPELMDAAAERFNARFAYRWARIADFLKLHYVLSERPERYWADHRDRASWPARLRDMMDRWAYEAPSREDFPQAREIFPAASYAYVLYGMGHRTEEGPRRRRRDDPARAARQRAAIQQRTERLMGGLPANRQLVELMARRGGAAAEQGVR